MALLSEMESEAGGAVGLTSFITVPSLKAGFFDLGLRGLANCVFRQ